MSLLQPKINFTEKTYKSNKKKGFMTRIFKKFDTVEKYSKKSFLNFFKYLKHRSFRRRKKLNRQKQMKKIIKSQKMFWSLNIVNFLKIFFSKSIGTINLGRKASTMLYHAQDQVKSTSMLNPRKRLIIYPEDK